MWTTAQRSRHLAQVSHSDGLFDLRLRGPSEGGDVIDIAVHLLLDALSIGAQPVADWDAILLRTDVNLQFLQPWGSFLLFSLGEAVPRLCRLLRLLVFEPAKSRGLAEVALESNLENRVGVRVGQGSAG